MEAWTCVTAVGFAGLLLASAAPAAAQAPPLRGLAVEETLRGPSVIANAIPANAENLGIPVVARLALELADFTGPDAPAGFARLDARLAAYRARGVSVVLALGSFPSIGADEEMWIQSVRAIADHARGRVAGYQVGDVSTGPLPDTDRYAYLLKRAAVQFSAPVFGGPIPASASEWLGRVYRAGIAAYTDGVAVDGPAQGDEAEHRNGLSAITMLVEREDPTACIVLGPFMASDQPNLAVPQVVNRLLAALGSMVSVTAFRIDAASLAQALATAARIADLFAGDLLALDGAAVGLRFFSGAVEATPRISYALLYSPGASHTYLVYWDAAGRRAVDFEVRMASMSRPMVRDPVSGAIEEPRRLPAGEGQPIRLGLPLADRPLVLDFNYGEAGRASTAGAEERALPSVEVIIARYQQVQAAADGVVRTVTAHMRMEQHFHPSPAEPAWNMVTENRLFADRSGVEWEELSFSLNGAKWTSHRPAGPLLQPEKVLSLPLDLRLNQDYRYRLDGLELVKGREAFVVRFDPASRAHALYRGTVWIDRRTYERLRVSAVQTRGNGVVVSNEEDQTFAPVGEVAGRPIWWLERLVSHQVFLVAGRNLLIDREIHLSEFEINGGDFEVARRTARTSDRLMYRDTDQGVRYFVKEGDQRVVRPNVTTSARALAMGLDVDPSLDTVLPIAGINILDFNFLHRDMQLALLFGGVVGFGNIQRPSLWGGRFDASVDFFGIALKSRDSLFDSRAERPGQRVRTIPAAVGASLGYQATSFQKVTVRYEFRYDAYFADAGTDATFVLPSNTGTSGEGVSYTYHRGGYAVTGGVMFYQRRSWAPWGSAGGGFDPATRRYARYDAGVSKDFIFATFHSVHLNAQYFGGQRLDRFSMYRFGLFDATRIHGVPSAVRFGDLGMIRGSYSFNLFDAYRVDVFLDHARGRNADIARRWRPVTGLGLGLNLRGPRTTIIRADVGKSFLPPEYRGAGSLVFQILVLKPL